MSQTLPPPSEWSLIPVASPPPGVTPNFANPPESLAPGATAAIAVILFLAMTTLVVRLYTKARIVRRFGWDDWTALIGGVLCLGAAGLSITILNIGGLGPHAWNVPLSKILDPAYSKRLATIQLMNQIDIYFIKLSIMFFLLRIFPRRTSPTIAYLLYAGVAFATITTFATTIYDGVVCVPKPSDTNFPTTCTTDVRFDIGITTAAVDAFLDLYLLAISVPAVLSLQMSRKKRWGIVLVLSTGLVACLCSLITLIYRINSPNLALTSTTTTDPTWSSVPSIALGMIEPLVALITACLPSTPSFWTEMTPRARESLRRLRSRITGQTYHSFSDSTFNNTSNMQDKSNILDSRNTSKRGTERSSLDDIEMGAIKREDRFEVHSIGVPHYQPRR